MRRFGPLPAALRATAAILHQHGGMGDASVAVLKIIEATWLYLSHSDIENHHVLISWSEVQHCCVTRLTQKPVEHFMTLNLDNQKRMIAEEVLSRNTVDRTPDCVREVINTALRHHAKAVILVHNHPSGDTEPSSAVIDMTVELNTAQSMVTITLNDHLIVTCKTVVSLKSIGLLKITCTGYLGSVISRSLSCAFRVSSPARRLASISFGRAWSTARLAASPAFLCTTGLRAAAMRAPMTSLLMNM